MFKSIRNISILPRLFITFALATAIPGIIIILLGSFYLNSMDVRGQAVKASFAAQQVATEQQISLQRMNALLQARFAQIFANGNAPLNGDPSLNASGGLIGADITARELDFDQTLTSYRENYAVATSNNMRVLRDTLLSDTPDTKLISDQQNALNAVAGSQWNAYRQYQDKVIALLNTPEPPYETAYATLYTADARFLDLQNSWQRVVDDATTIGTTVTNVGPAQTGPVQMYTIGAFLFTLLVIIAAFFLINLTIIAPLRQLALLTKDIARGERNKRATISGRDEISIVASSMNTMLDNIVHLLQEADTRHAVLQTQVEKLVNEVSGLGEGDLSAEAQVTRDSLGMLASSFNFMMKELSNLVVRVKIHAQEVENATAQAFNRMAQLVQGADIQIQQIGKATVVVDEMANSSNIAAQRAQEIYKGTQVARMTAQNGRSAVLQTVQGIDRISTNVRATSEKMQLLGNHSKEINNIVGVISNIAYQTNRLALDAAIQAAMAGANGKGFGAVADDIRRLAERAKQQTNMIERIVNSFREDIDAAALAIHDTEHETEAGTKLVQEAGSALESIFSVVEHQANEVEKINQVVKQQVQSSGAVAQIMQTIFHLTQQSSISTREEAVQMENLAQLAMQLRGSVEVFKLRENEAHYPSPNTPSWSGDNRQRRRANGPRTIPSSSPSYQRENMGYALQGPGQVNTFLPQRSNQATQYAGDQGPAFESGQQSFPQQGSNRGERSMPRQ